MLQYTVMSLSIVSTGPALAELRATVQVGDSVDAGISSQRSIAIPMGAPMLGQVNTLIDAIVAGMSARISGAPIVTRQASAS